MNAWTTQTAEQGPRAAREEGRGSHCRGCGAELPAPFLELGAMPPVNAFLAPSEIPNEEAFALDLCFCSSCTLVQLRECVPPGQLFTEYLHLSSASQSNVRHLESVAAMLASRVPGGLAGKQVLEIGSNDGTLLSHLAALAADKPATLLGVDPARNLSGIAREKGVETVTAFFDEDAARRLKTERGASHLVVGLNVVAHTPDFLSLLRGVAGILEPDGLFVMEAAYVVDTILQGQFDTIYHEHVYCFSLHALVAAMARAGLVVQDAEIIPTQGTSIRVFAARADSGAVAGPAVRRILEDETRKGYTKQSNYEAVREQVDRFRQELRDRIDMLVAETGEKLIGLGAPARGVVILNACELGADRLEFVVDDTVLKQGRLVPGVHLPVAGWEALRKHPVGRSRAFLLLSWNYRDEIMEKLRQAVPEGTLLLPFPRLAEIRWDASGAQRTTWTAPAGVRE